jgi:hypothetical protein
MEKFNLPTDDQLAAMRAYYAAKDARKAARQARDNKLANVCYGLAILCASGSAFFTGSVMAALFA